MSRLILIIATIFIFSKCNNVVTKKENEPTKWISLEKSISPSVYTLLEKNGVSCGDDPDDEITHMKNVDSSTFEVWEDSNYARDKNHVYYPIMFSCLEYEDGNGVCYCAEYIVQNANPKTFKYLGYEYAQDGDLFFLQGKQIDNMDEKTKQQLIAQ